MERPEYDEEKPQCCCFTGHRNIDKLRYGRISDELVRTVEELETRGITHYYAGGAIGFDLVAAVTVANIKVLVPDITMTLALPYPGYNNSWSRADSEIFRKVMKRADEVIYVSEGYYGGCMLARDRFMVDRCGTCICYLEKATGGTAYTVNYAIKKELDIINIASAI